MVVVFGCVSFLKEVEEFIEEILFELDVLMWEFFLVVCRIYYNVGFVEIVVEYLFDVKV